MKNRSLVGVISSRLQEKTPLIQVIVGPRQVGKTTAVKTALRKFGGVYQTADYPTPLKPEVIESWWSEAKKDKSKVLVIDEVQKITGWPETVKRLWDAAPKKVKLILTGSSALLMEKGLKETLVGRYELIQAEHWNFSEAARVFNQGIEEYIEFGCYPGSMDLFKDVSRWGTYIRDSIVEPVLGRDLLQLHPVDNPALLRQTFGVAIANPAQVISLQKIQGQLQGKGTIPTIQVYLKLLSQAFLVSGIEKYSSVTLRTKKSIPKLVVHDNSLIRSSERPVDQKIPRERFGRYFENAIIARFIEAGWDTFYWKERNHEVDIVVLGPNGEKWAIEVKVGKTDRNGLKGLFYFCERHSEFVPCLVSLVPQQFEKVKYLDPKEILSLSRKY